MKRIGFLLALVLLASGVFGTQGVSPGSYDVGFEPGLERSLVFDFVLDGKGDLSVEGDLKDYVSLDKDFIWDRESVVVHVKLPSSEEGLRPGVNNVWIVAGDVRGLIKIDVPYPEDYIEFDLAAPNVNIGEDVVVNLKVVNFGKEGRNVTPVVKIYYGIEVISGLEGSEKWVEGLGEINYEFLLDSANYSSGIYSAEVSFEEFEGSDIFRLGEKELRILDYTRKVNEGGLEKFEIAVESLWDDDMKEVFAEVRVIGKKSWSGEVTLDRVGGFDSSIVSLGAWDRKVLTGYFDSDGFGGEAMLSIDVHYDGETISEIVRIDVVRSYTWIWWVVGILIVGIVGWKVYWKINKD